MRNSGAISVVEGCGTNGCEYMTGGMVTILGSVGDNFAAGMTGGMAFIYDADNLLPVHINDESVVYQRLASRHWEEVLKGMIADHVEHTQSPFAESLLANWSWEREHFYQVCPKEMINKLAQPLSDEVAQQSA